MPQSTSFTWRLFFALLLVALGAIIVLGIISRPDLNYVTDSDLIVPDSSLNPDTLQITARPFDIKEPEIGTVWISRAGNRMLLLQYNKKKNNWSRWGGWTDYYHTILGVLVDKTAADKPNNYTYYYVRYKADEELRQKISRYFSAKYTQNDFGWK